MMRSRLAARPARLVLAAAAVAALAATATACDSDDLASAGSSTASAPAPADSGAGNSPAGGSTSSASAAGGPSTGSATGGSHSGGSTDANASEESGKSGYGQACGTDDLNFTVTSQTQAGGYYLVTAKAKSGISCYLDVNTPSVSFGSGADGVASPVGQGGEDPIKLSGSAVAYTGVSPKTTNGNGGVQFDHVIIATTEDDPNPAELKLPDTATVDKPIVTNWSTDRSETVPVIV